MRIIPGNAQYIGSRKEQQDDFGFSDIDDSSFVSHGGVLALVTDGMGGLSKGREASLIAKNSMLSQYDKKSIDESMPEALNRSLIAANNAVVEMARLNGLEGEVGTTLVAAAIKDNELYWVSVGDSRIYLWRDGKMTQLSIDHDFAMRLSKEVLRGSISAKEAENHPERDALVSYLGLQELIEVDRNEEPFILEVGDRILLCSDGLYNAISEKEISRLILGHPQNAADALTEAVITKSTHNQDNVTVAILGCEPDIALESHSNRQMETTIHKKRYFAVISILLLSILGGYIAHYYINHQAQSQSNINRDATKTKTDSILNNFSNGKISRSGLSKTEAKK
jgi:serine/threonine protein phosphatase PrpC